MATVHGDSVAPVRSARSWGARFVQTRTFVVLSRAGFVARALVYGIIGLLAFELATGQGGKITNQQGALRTVEHQPFGHLLLVLVAVGLGGYALWRFFRAALGHGPPSPAGSRSTLFDRSRATSGNRRDDLAGDVLHASSIEPRNHRFAPFDGCARQPDRAAFSKLGYGNNADQHVTKEP